MLLDVISLEFQSMCLAIEDPSHENGNITAKTGRQTSPSHEAKRQTARIFIGSLTNIHMAVVSRCLRSWTGIV